MEEEIPADYTTKAEKSSERKLTDAFLLFLHFLHSASHQPHSYVADEDTSEAAYCDFALVPKQTRELGNEEQSKENIIIAENLIEHVAAHCNALHRTSPFVLSILLDYIKNEGTAFTSSPLRSLPEFTPKGCWEAALQHKGALLLTIDQQTLEVEALKEQLLAYQDRAGRKEKSLLEKCQSLAAKSKKELYRRQMLRVEVSAYRRKLELLLKEEVSLSSPPRSICSSTTGEEDLREKVTRQEAKIMRLEKALEVSQKSNFVLRASRQQAQDLFDRLESVYSQLVEKDILIEHLREQLGGGRRLTGRTVLLNEEDEHLGDFTTCHPMGGDFTVRNLYLTPPHLRPRLSPSFPRNMYRPRAPFKDWGAPYSRVPPFHLTKESSIDPQQQAFLGMQHEPLPPVQETANEGGRMSLTPTKYQFVNSPTENIFKINY